MDTKTNNNKDLSYYLGLNWTYTIEKDHDGTKPFYIIRVNELPGVCTDAYNLDEGMLDIKESISSAIQLYLDHNEEVPEPIKEEDYKGNISYRTTKNRHFALVKEAQKKNKSISKVLDEIIDSALHVPNNRQLRM